MAKPTARAGIFLDAIHHKVKENHQYQTKAAYVVLGITILSLVRYSHI